MPSRQSLSAVRRGTSVLDGQLRDRSGQPRRACGRRGSGPRSLGDPLRREGSRNVGTGEVFLLGLLAGGSCALGATPRAQPMAQRVLLCRRAMPTSAASMAVSTWRPERLGRAARRAPCPSSPSPRTEPSGPAGHPVRWFSSRSIGSRRTSSHLSLNSIRSMCPVRGDSPSQTADEVAPAPSGEHVPLLKVPP